MKPGTVLPLPLLLPQGLNEAFTVHADLRQLLLLFFCTEQRYVLLFNCCSEQAVSLQRTARKTSNRISKPKATEKQPAWQTQKGEGEGGGRLLRRLQKSRFQDTFVSHLQTVICVIEWSQTKRSQRFNTSLSILTSLFKYLQTEKTIASEQSQDCQSQSVNPRKSKKYHSHLVIQTGHSPLFFREIVDVDR